MLLRTYMGDGTELDLTRGAVAAMSRLEQGLRPVLQLAEAPRPTGTVGGQTELYGLLLSDGVHSQEGLLVTSLNGLVRAGLLRRGSVVRVLDYVCSNSVENPRVITVIQLEILQTECIMIGSPTMYEVSAAQPKMGSYSDNLGIQRNLQILALTGGSVSGFNGQSVGTTSASRLKMNPDLPEAEKLRQWYVTESTGNACRTIAQIKDENFGMLGQSDLITVVAALSYVHTDAFCYPACTLIFNGKQCSKKVIANGDGWWCKRCLRSSETCNYRYILTCQIHDHSGSTYATAFHEAAEEIIGNKAQELFTMINVQQDDVKVEEIMQEILWCEYLFKVRVKVGPGRCVKLCIVKAEKFDASEMSRYVLGEIDNLLKCDSSSAPGHEES